MSGRDAAGRFAPGFSPDRGRGREAAGQSIAGHAALRSSVLTVANAPTAVRNANGRRHSVPLFEALLLRLATGQSSRRSSPTAFLRLVIECASAQPSPEQPALTVNANVIAAKESLDAIMLTGTDAAVDAAVAAYMAALRGA